jgi:hypothetical protein
LRWGVRSQTTGWAGSGQAARRPGGLVGLIDLLNWNDVDIRSKQVLGGK